MNNINNKIDLESKIFNAINNKVLGLSPSYKRLVSYFLREDLISTLGKTSFDDDEIDLLSTKEKNNNDTSCISSKDGILITTIYGSSYKINYRHDGLDAYKISTDENGKSDLESVKKIFSITLGPDVITNTVIAPKGIVGPEFAEHVAFELESTYEVNIPDSTFKYSCGEPGKVPCFKACLSSFNAKFSSHEMLSYHREIPPIEKERNLFKRLMTRSVERGEGFINITTSSSLTELTDYADDIFAILKAEAAKVNKSQDNNYGKYLRAINEEK